MIILMPAISTEEKKTKTLDNKYFLWVILIFLIVLLSFFWLRKGAMVGEWGEKGKVLPSPTVIKGREPERINRDEKQIKTETKMQVEQITIINSPGVRKNVGIDTSTKYRLAVLNFLKKSLSDFGYTMTINNLATVTDSVKPVAGEENNFFESACGQYRFEVNPTTKKINIYYYVNSTDSCPELFIMKPIQGAFMKMGGGISFWSSGIKAIFEPEALVYQADDAPFVTVVP